MSAWSCITLRMSAECIRLCIIITVSLLIETALQGVVSGSKYGKTEEEKETPAVIRTDIQIYNTDGSDRVGHRHYEQYAAFIAVYVPGLAHAGQNSRTDNSRRT